MKIKQEFHQFFHVAKLIHKICPSYLPLVIFSEMLGAAANIFTLICSAAIIDCLIRREQERAIQTAVMFVLTRIVLMLVRWGTQKATLVLRRKIDDMTSAEITKKALTLDYQVMEKAETMDYIQRAKEGSMATGSITNYCQLIADIITHILQITGCLIILVPVFFQHHLALAGICFSVLSVLFVFFHIMMMQKTNILEYRSFEQILRYNRYFSFFTGLISQYPLGKQIRIFQMTPMLIDMMKAFESKFQSIQFKFLKISFQYSFAIEILDYCILPMCSYAFIGFLALHGIISIGQLTLYTGAITSFFTSIAQLGNIFLWCTKMNYYLQNYIEFLQLKNEKYDGTLPIEKRLDNEYELEFKNVSFHYPNSSELVLKNITAKIHVGKKLAIVGTNGSGKSTFIKLLCRLYDPTEGEILLNGINIKKYDYDEYRQIFAVVFQDFRLYSFSFAQNIAAGIYVDREKVKRCLQQAGLWSRVESLQKGMDTLIYKQGDEDGIELSGGESQKTAIARALYKDAPLVILDEPTAALDPISELEIYERFDNMVNEKTAIYISHRMSSCHFCENILVFENGNIVQHGSHETLLAQDGLYAKLWHAQAQYYT